MSMIKYKSDYLGLALAIGLYIAAILRFQAIPRYLLFATVAFALFYILWGIFHHAHTHTLAWRVVLEYFLVAILAIVIVSTLLV